MSNAQQTATSAAEPKETTQVEMSGGKAPVKKEFTSFVSLFLLGLSAVLGVLLVNEMRSSETVMVSEKADQAEVMVYEMPTSPVIRGVVELPEPDLSGDMSVEEAIQSRRSQRVYSEEPVTLAELGQVLWAAQGVTDESGHRAAPSAKSAYPYSLYVVVRNVADLDPGLYVYQPETHSLGDLGMVNASERLVEAGVQENSQTAPVVIAQVATYAKMLERFPDSDPHKNVYLEGGHIGQNVYLQVEALGLGTVVTGGFNPMAVGEALEIDTKNQSVVYLIPFGNPGEAPAEE